METKLKRAIGIYSILLGCLILATWIIILIQQTTNEGSTEMLFHLASEALLAALCILGGLRIIQTKESKLILVAHGMNIYSVLNAAGYYGQAKGIVSALPFLLLGIISTYIIVFMMKKNHKNESLSEKGFNHCANEANPLNNSHPRLTGY